MVASVNKTQEDEIDNDTSFNVCNWFSKWNRMLVKQQVICSSTKFKNMSTKQESVSDATLKVILTIFIQF